MICRVFLKHIIRSFLYIIQVQYLLKWTGYEKPTWEPEENCQNCLELLAEFEEMQAGNPKPVELSDRTLTAIFGE